MSPRLSIYSLGALEVEVPNRSFAGLSGGKSSALLMVLAMRPECRYSREMLADMFWPSLPIQSARKNLRHTFFLLREALGDCGEQPFFLFAREWLSFNPRSNFWIDARELAAAEPRAMPAEVAKVERLAALCRGEFMAGFSLPDCPAFEDWLQGQRGDLRLRAVTLLEHLAHHHEEAGSYEKGLEFARRLLALDPSNEALHRRVLRLCGPSGQLPTEKTQHDACQTALGNGLGARPNNEETAALLRQRLEAKARADGRATAQEDASLLAPPTERRQVTVLYCELRFADIDDADEAAERLREPQQRCADIVRRHGGYVGQSHGGGLLAYFGYPDAREDAARRAVAAAQSLGEAAAPAVARCGVHTGLIATAPGLRVPDLVGKTSDLAIHLRIAVEEGTALSRETFRLVEGYVHCQPLGPRVLVTGDRPVEVYRVERPAVASQGPASAARLSPFVDREEEIGRLSATFRQVCAGKPAVVLVRGDPGIGKSRLIAEVQRRAVAEKDCALLESFCLPEHQGTPFFPFAGILQSSTPPAGPAATEQTQRRRLMNSMQEALLALSSQRPLLVLVEDLQWADSSSLDLLRMLGKRLESERVLILLTGRPEVDPSGWLPSDALVLELEHLPEEPSRQLANHWSAALPAEQVESIVAQADGVPLFIEEVARWKATHEGSDRAAPTIPATLQDLLMARIDQLGGARRLAQVGAACGRDFEPRLLAGVAQEEGLDVEGGIQGLLRSGLVLAVEERLQFKHALIQKAAYESQSRSLRRETHRRIACALQRDFPERCQSRPEALARHLTEAGEIAQAVGWWRAAGDAAARCWSYGEAVAHFNKALRLLADLPPSRERDRQELELALALGAQLIPATGFGSRETRECHARAYALCRGSDDRERLFRVIYGQWMGASSTYGLYFHAEELSGQLDRLAEMSGRGDFALAAHVARIATLYWMGRHAAIAPHVEAARAWFGRIDLDAYMQTIGLEPRVYALAFSGLSRWFLGHPDEAMATAREALAMAEESANVGARCFALSAAGLLERHLRQPDQVLERCAALSGLARTCAIPLWAAFAQSLRGWAQAARGEPEGRLLTSESLKEIREHCPGAEVAFGLLHLEALAALGAFEQLAAEADVLIDSAQRRHDGHVTPELHRLKGESLLAVSPENRGAAEACFREALELARAGGMQMLELRAAVSIYRMRQDAESRSSLAGVLARLDATSSHPDLLEARGLVECRAV